MPGAHRVPGARLGEAGPVTTIAPARRIGGTELIDPVELAERLGLRRPTDEQAAVIGAPSEPA
ncbi:hypothetical protein G3I26_08505, partial [Streptomyces sp. SID7909]|nr:hypothetical protein [Streptomyces sp. SID7909]